MGPRGDRRGTTVFCWNWKTRSGTTHEPAARATNAATARSLAAGHQSPLTGSRKRQAGANILTSQVREVAKNVVLRHARGQVLQHVRNRDAQAANARLPAALARLIVIRRWYSTPTGFSTLGSTRCSAVVPAENARPQGRGLRPDEERSKRGNASRGAVLGEAQESKDAGDTACRSWAPVPTRRSSGRAPRRTGRAQQAGSAATSRQWR